MFCQWHEKRHGRLYHCINKPRETLLLLGKELSLCGSHARMLKHMIIVQGQHQDQVERFDRRFEEIVKLAEMAEMAEVQEDNTIE
jgi:hypothetical protein